MAKKIKKAIISSIWSSISYIVIPIVIFSILSSKLPKEISIGDIKTTQMYILIFGLAIVICTFFKTYFEHGSILRLIFGILMISFICFWLFAILNGGIYDIAFEENSFHIDFSKLVLLIVFVTSLKGVYLVAEFIFMRKKQLEKPKEFQPLEQLYPSHQPRYPVTESLPNFDSHTQYQLKYQSSPKPVVVKKIEKKSLKEDEWLE